MPSSTTKVSCPSCKRLVDWTPDAPYRPFCSERCKIIDLGAWADESHSIAGEPVDLDTNLTPRLFDRNN